MHDIRATPIGCCRTPKLSGVWGDACFAPAKRVADQTSAAV